MYLDETMRVTKSQLYNLVDRVVEGTGGRFTYTRQDMDELIDMVFRVNVQPRQRASADLLEVFGRVESFDDEPHAASPARRPRRTNSPLRWRTCYAT
jgi:hypothetical protein